jgi:hypothetical protein
MGARGRAWVQQEWSWDATVRDLLGYYSFDPE